MQNPNTTHSIIAPPPNKNFLFNINYILSFVVLYVMSLVIFSISRLVMQIAFVDSSASMSDKLALYKYGFLYDTRVICIALMVYLAIIYVLKPLGFFLKNYNFLSKMIFYIYNVYAFALGFVCASFSIVNFYYYEMYKTKIDIFIFGLKDDNTKEILGIIFRDYPVAVLLICIFVIATLFALVNAKILSNRFSQKLQTFFVVKTPIFILANLILLALLFIGARGSFSSFPLGEKDSNISTLASINAINPNPILAFAWALGYYQSDNNYTIANKEAFDKEFATLQNELFALHHKSPKSSSTNPTPKPHIIINLMESFGSGAISLDDMFCDEKCWSEYLPNDAQAQNLQNQNLQNQQGKNPKLDLLGKLKTHFINADIFNHKSHQKTSRKSTQQNLTQTVTQDFVFWRFFSSHLGTAPSFFDLYFLSPTINISTGKMKKEKLPNAPLTVLEKNGYDIVFVTSSSGSWVNITEYLKNQGIHQIHDAPYLISKYQEATTNQNSFGINDEYIYKDIIEILKSATKPTAIFTLTTSNHPPFITPSEFDEINAPHISTEVTNTLNQKAKTKKVLGSFLYSNNAFGEFLSALKDSKIGKNTIVFATGDHHLRDLKSFVPRYNALNFAVPLYIYIPKEVQDSLARSGRAIDYDPLRVGSHKDIFPSIFELFLDSAQYFSLGGRNILGKTGAQNDFDKYEFGINAGIWADREGIYYNGSLFRWKNNAKYTSLRDLLEVETTPSASTQEKQDFKHKFDRLNQMQFLWRLNKKLNQK
ncbi:LTA synthase family protein [Helicobacter sp. T3_23-1056]